MYSDCTKYIKIKCRRLSYILFLFSIGILPHFFLEYIVKYFVWNRWTFVFIETYIFCGVLIVVSLLHWVEMSIFITFPKFWISEYNTTQYYPKKKYKLEPKINIIFLIFYFCFIPFIKLTYHSKYHTHPYQNHLLNSISDTWNNFEVSDCWMQWKWSCEFETKFASQFVGLPICGSQKSRFSRSKIPKCL